MQRPQFYRFHNGSKDALPFSHAEYSRRLTAIRARMTAKDIDALVLTSMHNVAYYTGFLYCAFGRPYAAVITPDEAITVSAAIDAGQPWRRSVADNITYTDWQRGNYYRAIADLLPNAKRIGIEDDHVTLQHRQAFADVMPNANWLDISADTMAERMIKSDEEIDLIKAGAAVADIGGHAIHAAIGEGIREIDVAMAGRDAMEAEIAKRFPDSEIRDTWVWFQSGINTDGAHNPVTCRKLAAGDLLSLNTFPMISGYYTALERTLFLGEPDAATHKAWQANLTVHEHGLSLIKPGATCQGITAELNTLFDELGYLDRRTFGYGHSFGVLSHYYGREAGLELREDIDTVLEAGMVVSMEPMITIGDDEPGRGGYREHDILVVTAEGAVNITGFPYGMDHNIIAV
ncbi:MAG: creatininase [Candidatus Puniceispirillum sp. TMED52]|nr:creatininase [SAR116 cluster bacterium]OUU44937.1 MAG: creatininase [Candidatus Puniceispirillum sp. TMED52]